MRRKHILLILLAAILVAGLNEGCRSRKSPLRTKKGCNCNF